MARWLRPSAWLLFLIGCAPPASSGIAPSRSSSAPAAATAEPSPSAAPPSPVASSDPLVGRAAPDFTATAQDGTVVHLKALAGHPVVLYFYPKDETPGCTKEACSFRDAWQALTLTGAILIGVSADTTDSHRSFAAHYGLPFLLVSDPDGSIAHLYGVPFGRVHARQTILVGADGSIRNTFRSVDVTTHAREVLGALSALK